MLGVMLAALQSLVAAFQPQRQLMLENLALRHQLIVLNRNAKKPRFRQPDRLRWICLRAVWSRWEKALVIIRLQTVIGCHRAGLANRQFVSSPGKSGTTSSQLVVL
jgi:hypothetical protein